jgi:hypothetical protein
LKLNGTHQILVYVDDVNVLGRSIHTIKKNTGALLVGSKEICLEGNADKTECMVMSRDQNAGQSHNIKIDNSSFERVQIFGNNLKSKFCSRRNNYRQIEVRECLLSLCTESFVFQFAIQKFKE